MRSALLIIDVQQAILRGLGTPERQPVLDAALDGVAARLQSLQANARAAGCPVVIVQHDGPEAHRLAVGSTGWAIRPEVAPVLGDFVVHKTACDSFLGTELLDILTNAGVAHLVIGGCMTQFCIDTTVRRAISLNFGVTLIADGHTTVDTPDLTYSQIIAHHNRTLNGFAAGSCRVEIANAADIVFARSATPN